MEEVVRRARSQLDDTVHGAAIAPYRALDLIEGTTSKDDAGRSKPFPDIFAAALDRVPDEARPGSWVVGDSPWDAQAASRLGLPTLGFRCGGFAEEDLRASGAEPIFDGPADLLSGLDRSPFEMRR